MSDSIRIADDIWGRGDSLINQLEAIADDDASIAKLYETAADGIVQATRASRAKLIATKGDMPFLTIQSPRLVVQHGSAVQGEELDADSLSHSETSTRKQLPDYSKADAPIVFEIAVAFASQQDASVITATDELSQAILAILTRAFTNQELRRLSGAVAKENDHSQWLVKLFDGTTPQESFAAIASAVASVSGADRVSLLKRNAKGYELVSTSTQSNVDRRAQQVRYLEEFVTHAMGDQTEFSYDGETSPELTGEFAAQEQYLSSSGAKTIVLRSVSLDQNDSSETSHLDDAVAAIMLETFDSAVIHRRSELNGVVDRAVCFAIKRDEVSFTETALRSFTQWSDKFSFARRLSCLALAGLAIFALLALIPAELKIPVSGKLVAAKSQKLFAPADAVTDEVLVHNGQSVRVGDALLRLRSAKLDLMREQIKGDLVVARTELAVAEASRSTSARPAEPGSPNYTASMQEVLKARIRGLSEQRKLLSKQLDDLTVRSPIDGVVVRWDVDQSLAHRVVAHGEYLMDVVSPEAGWQVQLDIPEPDSGYVITAHEAKIAKCRLRLTSANENMITANLNSLDQTTVIARDGQAVLRGNIDLTDVVTTDTFRIGATVVGSIECGQRSIGFVWFRSLIQWWRQQSWF